MLYEVITQRADWVARQADYGLPLAHTQDSRFTRTCIDPVHQHAWLAKLIDHISSHVARAGRRPGGDDHGIALGQSAGGGPFQSLV